MISTPPSDAQVTLLFEKFSAFVEDYASNLSMGSMFLATTDLRPVGSIVDFEIKLTDGFELVRGLGEVIWVLPGDHGAPDDGALPPAGLAVRFQFLDERGRELILRIMEEQVKSGGEPFDLDAVPAGALVSSESASPAAEAGSEAPVAADEDSPAPLPDAPDAEPKILGEDGFTLLDADDPQSSPGVVRPQRVFEELEFDAPWGEHLPEIPQEVLEEGLEAEVTLPLPDAQAAEPPGADEDLFELDDRAAPAPSPVHAVPDLDVDRPEKASFENSFQLAEEAVAELELTPPTETGEPDFEDIDFSVPSADDEPARRAAASSAAVDTDDGFELEWEGESSFSETAPLEEEDVTVFGQRPAEASVVDDEDPTLLTSAPRTAPSLGEPSPGEPLPLESQDVAATVVASYPAGEAEVDPFELAPEASAPAAPAAEPSGGPPTVAAAAVAAQPAVAVQGYEDDLFTDVPGATTGQVLRQGLAGSGRLIALASLVFALAGVGYVYRDALGELVGLGGSEVLPPVASRPPAGEQPPAASVESLPSEPGEPGSAATAAVPPEVEDVESLSPPVIDVAVVEAAAVPGVEPASAQTEAAVSLSPPAIPLPSASSPGSVVSASPATRVDQITWRRGEGGTLVTVELDGDLADGRYVHSALTWAPDREMVEVKGIAEPYVSGRIEVGSPEIQQLRIGHHVKPGGNVLRIVFDFPGAGPRVAEVRGRGDRLEILVQR